MNQLSRIWKSVEVKYLLYIDQESQFSPCRRLYRKWDFDVQLEGFLFKWRIEKDIFGKNKSIKKNMEVSRGRYLL